MRRFISDSLVFLRKYVAGQQRVSVQKRSTGDLREEEKL